MNEESLRNIQDDYGRVFDVPSPIIVRVDSFKFCENYKMTKRISTGGTTVTVTVINSNNTVHYFQFDSSKDRGEFDLRAYLYCYLLLKNRIPPQLLSAGFFSEVALADIVMYYLKAVECEGYYYREYTQEKADMTAQERRMMKGWDFRQYMEKRNSMQ